MPFPLQPTPCLRRFLPLPARVTFPAALCLALALPALGQPAHPTSFEVAFPSSLHAAPVTGRMFVFIAKTNQAEPRHQLLHGSAVFAINVTAQRPGASAIIGQSTPGFPPGSLKDVPAGDYYVQVA